MAEKAEDRAGKLKNHGYEPQSKLWKLYRSKLRGIIPSAARDCSTYQYLRAAHTVLEFHNKRETIGIAVWLLIAAFVMICSWNIGLGEYANPGPGFFPFWSALLLGVLSLLIMVDLYLTPEAVAIEGKTDLWKDFNWGKVTVIITALFAYCLVLTKLGYLISTMALMMVLFYMGKMKPWAVIAGSMLAVLLSYCLFLYGLKTPLPKGILVF